MVLRSFRAGAVLLVAAGAIPAASAQTANSCSTYFGAEVTVASGQSATICFTTAQEFLDFYVESTFSSRLAASGIAYNSGDPFTSNVVFNSIPGVISSSAGDPSIKMEVPALGISETFAGATRTKSKRLLENYFKANNADVLSKVIKYQAVNSPSSPIVGQGGLMPTMVSSDFSSSFSEIATNVGPSSAPSASSTSSGGSGKGGTTGGGTSGSNLIGFGLQYSALNLGNQKVRTATLPLSYTIQDAGDPRHQLQISLPLTVGDAAGAKTYYAGLGLAWRLPVNSQWTLSPGAKVSGAGSKDLAIATAMGAVSLTSAYVIDLDRVDIAIGNMIGRYKSFKLKVDDFSVDPKIANTVYRNGVMLLHPVGERFSLEYSLIDTRYTGTKLYYDSVQEVGITVGTNKRASSTGSFVRAGLSYLRSKDADGVQANFGYWF